MWSGQVYKDPDLTPIPLSPRGAPGPSDGHESGLPPESWDVNGSFAGVVVIGVVYRGPGKGEERGPVGVVHLNRWGERPKPLKEPDPTWTECPSLRRSPQGAAPSSTSLSTRDRRR